MFAVQVVSFLVDRTFLIVDKVFFAVESIYFEVKRVFPCDGKEFSFVGSNFICGETKKYLSFLTSTEAITSDVEKMSIETLFILFLFALK